MNCWRKSKLSVKTNPPAWRCTYEWIRAQVALILSGQVEPAEVFLAYVVDGQGQTLYRHLEEQGFAGYLAAPEQAERTAIVDMREDAIADGFFAPRKSRCLNTPKSAGSIRTPEK